jgi:chaperonin GroEL (HSP60 family)
MHSCTRKTALTVRPTSILLNDPIDINAFVKIVTVNHPSQNSGRFVNGIVFKKDIANRRMRNNIEKPRILLLANSLGYVQEDGLALVDLEREIEQEEALIRII